MVVRGHVDLPANGPVTSGTVNGPGPACRYVNVELVDSTADQGVVGTVLLENPYGRYIITHKEFLTQVQNVCRISGHLFFFANVILPHYM